MRVKKVPDETEPISAMLARTVQMMSVSPSWFGKWRHLLYCATLTPRPGSRVTKNKTARGVGRSSTQQISGVSGRRGFLRRQRLPVASPPAAPPPRGPASRGDEEDCGRNGKQTPARRPVPLPTPARPQRREARRRGGAQDLAGLLAQSRYPPSPGQAGPGRAGAIRGTISHVTWAAYNAAIN